jgi:hypothetical protein
MTMVVSQFNIISFEKNVNNIKECERIFLTLDDNCTPKQL